MCPGHFWLVKFGKVPGNNNCVEKKFKLGARQYEENKGVRFGNADNVPQGTLFIFFSLFPHFCFLQY